jgi:hypothetical protein
LNGKGSLKTNFIEYLTYIGIVIRGDIPPEFNFFPKMVDAVGILR